ncbi:hypothetical protein JTE90_000400 [Oedothorax gibbosus]|uniref:Uncharacterized protein n=1 Tax=Oedothorax gibbosus TaxID=931172 RepID=A0AAV6UT66_9ARAC|nr:hypothetical protein JTE90_000400 [Oedothorax gibbosus]
MIIKVRCQKRQRKISDVTSISPRNPYLLSPMLSLAPVRSRSLKALLVPSELASLLPEPFLFHGVDVGGDGHVQLFAAAHSLPQCIAEVAKVPLAPSEPASLLAEPFLLHGVDIGGDLSVQLPTA